MTQYSPTIRINTEVGRVRETSDPEKILRHTLDTEYGMTFQPYTLQFHNDYSVVERFSAGVSGGKFLEILIEMVCKQLDRKFTGEVLFAQRNQASGLLFEDCGLHKLGEALEEYLKIKGLPPGADKARNDLIKNNPERTLGFQWGASVEYRDKNTSLSDVEMKINTNKDNTSFKDADI